MRHLLFKRTAAIIAALIVVLAYFTWPWANALPMKWGPLKNYRVFDYGDEVNFDASRAGWRAPTSRTELLLTSDYRVHVPRQRTNLQSGGTMRIREPASNFKPLPHDDLHDFVVDYGDWFGHPDSQEELEKSLELGTAHRASTFFSRRHGWEKPFYGEIPTSLCYGDEGTGIGVRKPNRLQIWQDSKLVDVSLKTPERPEIFVVSGSTIWQAQESVHGGDPPVAFPHDQYWAVVFAGSGASGPPKFLIDRVTIGNKSAEILLCHPPISPETCDIHPYWFFVPLGRLPDGQYSVEVRIANEDKIILSTSATLRRATDQEVASRNEAGSAAQKVRSQHYERTKMEEHEHGAALQLHLERLAEFIHSAEVSPEDRALLASDVARLGESVYWDVLRMYGGPSNSLRELAAPTPGETPSLEFVNGTLEYYRTPWSPSDIQLGDIWLCDGTDAGWYSSANYRSVPELSGALTAENPSPAQDKIKRIWKALEAKSNEGRDFKPLAFAAAGTIYDAIDAAYDMVVDGKEPVKSFSPEDEMWAVLVARHSFLPRQIATRFYEDKIRKWKRTEFMVTTSAYISKADGVAEEVRSPITFALIPLGRQPAGHSVGVMFTLKSVCSRRVGTQEPELLDAKPPDMLFNNFWGYLPSGTGFQIAPKDNASASGRK